MERIYYRGWLYPLSLFLAGVFLLLLAPVLAFIQPERNIGMYLLAAVFLLGGLCLAYFSGGELFDFSPRLKLDDTGITDFRYPGTLHIPWNTIAGSELYVESKGTSTFAAQITLTVVSSGAPRRIQIDVLGLGSRPKRIYQLIQDHAPL